MLSTESLGGGRVEGIADYRFVRSLGEGSHGAFYLATPPARLKVESEYVGVKVVAGASNADNLRRATRELRAFAAASSPFLVTLLDAGRQDDMFFYAMEHCALGSLESPEQPLSRVDVLVAVAQAARGAHALHEAGLVHRSIKPASVLLHASGARLADLGLVQALRPAANLTGLGSMSDVEYTEPALLSGQDASPATDIWSIGVTLHRALAGAGIYGSMPMHDPLLCVRKVLTERPTLSTALTPADAAVVARCLAVEPEDRPGSAEALAEEIEALI